MQTSRIIGERTGKYHGSLFLILSQIHGNEPAGLLATHALFEAIDREYELRPDFNFVGKIIGMTGNVRASKLGVRYIDKDLNRSWSAENIQRIKNTNNLSSLQSEDVEILEILSTLQNCIDEYKPTNLVVLDLHTTTASGGIFTIPALNTLSRRLGLELHAPIVHGFLNGLAGTTLHYFTETNTGLETTAVCFEAGQHQSPESPKLALSAIINCFRTVGGFAYSDVELRHDTLLKAGASNLPRETKLIYTHSIGVEDGFSMRTDKIFLNFEPVEQGDWIANDVKGKVFAPVSGHILMPLYQKLGSDGFFIVEEMQAEPAHQPKHLDLVEA